MGFQRVPYFAGASAPASPGLLGRRLGWWQMDPDGRLGAAKKWGFFTSQDGVLKGLNNGTDM